jgi:hypothetical protein
MVVSRCVGWPQRLQVGAIEFCSDPVVIVSPFTFADAASHT